MAPPKTANPAAAGATTGLQETGKLATTTINPSNNTSASKPQASPDDIAESDFDYFLRHRDLSERLRFPFENEFPGLPGEAGDAVSVRGKMKLEIFEARISRSIFADAARTSSRAAHAEAEGREGADARPIHRRHRSAG